MSKTEQRSKRIRILIEPESVVMRRSLRTLHVPFQCCEGSPIRDTQRGGTYNKI